MSKHHRIVSLIVVLKKQKQNHHLISHLKFNRIAIVFIEFSNDQRSLTFINDWKSSQIA